MNNYTKIITSAPEGKVFFRLAGPMLFGILGMISSRLFGIPGIFFSLVLSYLITGPMSKVIARKSIENA